MAPYIGTPTSRVDGHAKVTGAAKYAGEFNAPGLAYGSVVTSTIAKGRIARIDASEALRVDGVLDVLTHENRPRMAATSSAYKDDVAPEKARRSARSTTTRSCSAASRSLWCVAEEPEIARFAASLVRVEYEKQAHSTDLFARRDKAFVSRRESRSTASRAAMPSGPMRRPRCATRPNITSRSSITIRWSCSPPRWSGRATASSRSMTRPRACRTCSTICAACSR